MGTVLRSLGRIDFEDIGVNVKQLRRSLEGVESSGKNKSKDRRPTSRSGRRHSDSEGDANEPTRRSNRLRTKLEN